MHIFKHQKMKQRLHCVHMNTLFLMSVKLLIILDAPTNHTMDSCSDIILSDESEKIYCLAFDIDRYRSY